MRFNFNSVYWIYARLWHSHSSDTMQMTQSKFDSCGGGNADQNEEIIIHSAIVPI